MRKLIVIVIGLIILSSCSPQPDLKNSLDKLEVTKLEFIDSLQKDTVIISYDEDNRSFYHYNMSGKLVCVSEVSKVDGFHYPISLQNTIVFGIILILMGVFIKAIITE